MGRRKVSATKQEIDWLRDLVQAVTEISERRFYRRRWACVAARNVFAYYCRKWLLMSEEQIAAVVKRDRSTVSTGIRSIVDLVAGNKGRVSKRSMKGRSKRADMVRRWMAEIQMEGKFK